MSAPDPGSRYTGHRYAGQRYAGHRGAAPDIERGHGREQGRGEQRAELSARLAHEVLAGGGESIATCLVDSCSAVIVAAVALCHSVRASDSSLPLARRTIGPARLDMSTGSGDRRAILA